MRIIIRREQVQLRSMCLLAVLGMLFASSAAASLPSAAFADVALPLHEGPLPVVSDGSIGLGALSDEEMGEVTGQALFFSDKIVGQPAHGIDNDFTFYRLGLDANLKFNINIDKLQLGCGGFNDGLVNNACDLDVDFMSFLGKDGPSSDFMMELPYLEIAVKNDGDLTRREVAGIKIGAATVEGILSIGRRYASGETNQEWGLVNGRTCGNLASTQDDGRRAACHSGANRMSAFLIGEISATGRIGDFGGADVCMGWYTLNPSDPCGIARRMFLTFSGTRMDRIGQYSRNDELITYNCGGTLAFLGCPNANFKLSQHIKFIHEIALTSEDPAPGFAGPRITRDFFLSFQRERIAYPIFDQSNPYATRGSIDRAPSTSLYNHAWESNTSAWSSPTNTGWWMNITYADLRDNNVGTLNLGGLFDALDALSAGGSLQDVDFGQVPVQNCFGSAQFC